MKKALFPMSLLTTGQIEEAKLQCEVLREEIRARVGRAVYAELRLWMVEGDAWAQLARDDEKFAQAARHCYREALALAKQVSSSSKIALATNRLLSVSVEAIAKRKDAPIIGLCAASGTSGIFTTMSGHCPGVSAQSMDF